MSNKYFYKRKLRIKRTKTDFIKKIRRQKRKARAKKGYQKYLEDMRKANPKIKTHKTPYHQFKKKSRLPEKPEYSDGIKHFIGTKDSFSKEKESFSSNEFHIPDRFSLIDNYTETTLFLRRFFNALYNQSFEKVIIDYKNCTLIDVGASICMDVILSDFIKYFERSAKDGHTVRVLEIIPRNYEKYDIKKILFSIGAFRNIRKFKIDFDNLIAFPVLIGNNKSSLISSKREVDITKTVDYIIESLKQLNRTLTADAETNLYKVIGEVIQNADEHSNTDRRYSIGYFEKTSNGDDNYGIFNLAILNFGNSIYETFKSPDCKNKEVVSQMMDLSQNYTKRSLFTKAEFEEETLWTLYALQDGVTRKDDWKRGNGSIRFIESFFRLKGNDVCDSVSKMVITSGHTRIIFNGEYNIVERPRGKENKLFKMMTFNKSGDIEEIPDKKYVTFENNYFPGTLISVKIRIDYENTEIIEQ